MPGIVVFGRRWSVGSDDFVIPGVLLFILHTVWLVILAIIYGMVENQQHVEVYKIDSCVLELEWQLIGYLVILSLCCFLEAAIIYVAMRGTIIDPSPRASMQYLLYIRLVILAVELAWLVVGVIWLAKYYVPCSSQKAKHAVLGIVICNGTVLMLVILIVWCTFDSMGRTRYKNIRRRQGEVSQDSQRIWDQRCKNFSRCVKNSNDTNIDAFTDIAMLLSEFFRDLDIVSSDVVAGLVLLRKEQKSKRRGIINDNENAICGFSSGVPIMPGSRFLQLSCPKDNEDFEKIVHYMRFALAVYGCPIHCLSQSTLHNCKLLSHLRCNQSSEKEDGKPLIIEDSYCACNTAALQDMAPSDGVELLYINYHNNIGETAFFVALDHSRRAVVVSIRGTLSLHDIITDLHAETEPIPLDTIIDDWLGHKGIIIAAEYMRKKLIDEGLLDKAFSSDSSNGTQNYDLVLVGHSLGAGTAAILSMLLKPQYPSLICFAYSPPGGLLSASVVEYSREFITSVVVGKDVIPRIGLHQMEMLRTDVLEVIKKSKEPKWKTISTFAQCCGGWKDSSDETDGSKSTIRDPTVHPSVPSIVLTAHQPMYPPGRILHIGRNYPNKSKSWIKSRKPVYQGMWVDNQDLDEVLISPCMVQDHMPWTVLNALEKVIIHSKELTLPSIASSDSITNSHQTDSNLYHVV